MLWHLEIDLIVCKISSCTGRGIPCPFALPHSTPAKIDVGNLGDVGMPTTAECTSRWQAAGINDVTEVDLQGVIVAAKRVARLLEDRLDLDGLGLFQSNRRAGPQEVLHFYLHVVPRYAGDALSLPWQSTTPDETVLTDIWATLQKRP
jgi:histidine triad (HIT) family protein